ncbi:hypothetical protein WICMUC_002070 [Wickerhamomyces mucosus]|uniref:Amino acid permease/ SLC12A domain-containing protein n=1 Tax=Wickerhamomyces mucosus TaxID=1378264 RepID=A0A9P8PSD8_9ASCO|nr:hypothetical protein WICMUC_002070 [Wickerhamomyces mucosus]
METGDNQSSSEHGLFPNISTISRRNSKSNNIGDQYNNQYNKNNDYDDERFEFDVKDSKNPDLYDNISITTNDVRETLTNIEPSNLTNKNHERFFFTKLFDHNNKSIQNYSDFSNYDRMIQREIIFENKFKKILNQQQNNHIKINENLDLEYNAGDELNLEYERNKSKKKPNFKSIQEIIKHPIKSHLSNKSNNYNYLPKILHSSISNDTEIIDLSNNEIANNLFKLDQDIDSKESNLQNLNKSFNQQNYNNHYHLQRKLEKHQIQMIALGGTLGVGLFLSSGKAFSIAGPLGCLLGFSISGSIVLATMLSFAEMSTLIPTTSSISGLASRFVEDAFGFALGWCYWFSFTIAMPGEVCAATIMLSYYTDLGIPGASSAGFVPLFLSFIIGINLLDVKIYGNIEFIFSLFKVIMTVVLIITMLIINVKQKYGFLYWDTAKSTIWETFGPFRPTFDLNDTGYGATKGITGGMGRFLSVLSAILISSYAYSGSEIGFIASMECKNPRKTLPSVTKRVFGRIVILYLLSIFLVGLNIYSGDPRLLRYYTPHNKTPVSQQYIESLSEVCHVDVETNYPNGSQSPWIIALQGAGYCSFSTVLNVILIIFAVSAGSSHLYTSSRTLYSMSIQNKAPKIFSRCTKSGVPFISILFTGSFGLLAYSSVNSGAMSAFQDFANISSATVMLMWSGMCLSFLRFYYALQYRPDIIARNDPSYPYRSPFQPFLAIYGLFGSLLIALLMGFVVFLKGFWDTKTFFTSYGSTILFVFFYLGYKFKRSSRIRRLDQLDLDSGRREMDRMIWDDEKNKLFVSFPDFFKRVVDYLY